jgi:hypothetical protein
LDYEDSIYPPSNVQADPWEKLRSLLMDELRKDVGSSAAVRNITWNDKDFCVQIVTPEGEEYNHRTRIGGTARSMIDQMYRGRDKSVLTMPGKECTSLFEMALTSPPAELYEYALAKAMTASRDTVVEAVTVKDQKLGGWRYTMNFTSSFDGDVVHAQLSQSAGPVVALETFEPWADEHSERFRHVRRPGFRNGVDFVSEWKSEAKRSTTVGMVRGIMDRSRLVMMGDPLENIPATPRANPTVELAFPATLFADCEPVLTGHRLTAAYRQGASAYYQYEPADHDPQKRQGEIFAPITDDTRQQLATMCESIGLEALAVDILRQSDFNIADLESLVQWHSTYAYENPAGDTVGAVPFKDLKNYVVEGVYHCQCSGAGYLLDHLLRAVYADDPSIEVRTAHGLVASRTIRGEGVISANTHAQNHIYKDGKLAYVLDATPTSSATGFGGLQRNHLDEDRAAPIEQIQGHRRESTTYVPSPEEIITPLPRTGFDSLTQQLHNILQLQHKVPNKTALYEKIAQLPRLDDDPTVKVLRLFWQDESAIEPSEVSQVLGYVRALRTFSKPERQHMGWGKYDDGMLDMLSDILVDLQQLRAAHTAGTAPAIAQ